MMADVKEQITDEFIELSKSKDPGKITVKDLVTGCGLSRQTFYYHFQDIYEVMAYAIQRDLHRISKESTEIADSVESAEHFIGSIMAYLPMLRRVFSSKLGPGLEGMLLEAYRKYFRELIESNVEEVKLTSKELTYLCDFLACSLLGEVISNCENETIDVPEYCRQLMLLVHARID